MLPFVPKASSPSSLPTHLTLTRTGNVHDDDAMIPAGLSSSSTFVADRDTQEPRSHALSSSSCSSPATPVCSCGPSGSAGEMQNLISLISHKVVQELKSSASSSSSSSSPPSPSGETVNQQQSHRHPHRHPDTVLSIAELILRAVDKVTVSAAPTRRELRVPTTKAPSTPPTTATRITTPPRPTRKPPWRAVIPAAPTVPEASTTKRISGVPTFGPRMCWNWPPKTKQDHAPPMGNLAEKKRRHPVSLK